MKIRNNISKDKPISTFQSASSNQEMAKLLKDIQGKINPMDVTYFNNGKRAELMKSNADKTTDPTKKLLLKMRYGMELISAGKMKMLL